MEKILDHLRQMMKRNEVPTSDKIGVLATMIGTTLPIIIGVAFDALPFSMVVSLGGFLGGSVGTSNDAKSQIKDIASAAVALFFAALSTTITTGETIERRIVLCFMLAVAAIIGGYNRYLAICTGRFIVFSIMALNMSERVAPLPLIIGMSLGGSITFSLFFFLGNYVRSHGWSRSSTRIYSDKTRSERKARSWFQSLKHLSGWQFPLRLVPCVFLGSAFELCFPRHHFLWIMLTIGILCRRQLELMPVKVSQRAVGAIVGVAATLPMVGHVFSGWQTVIFMMIFSPMAAVLRGHNYLGYTVVMTPLVISLLSVGKPISEIILIDRIFATIIGAFIVLFVNFIVSHILPRKEIA